MTHLVAPRAVRRNSEPLPGEPVVIAFDPGVTTGWSVMRVHPDALQLPNVSILENVLHWAHGQIVSDPVDFEAVGSPNPKRQKEMELISRAAGNGWVVDTSTESHAVHQMVDLVRQWPGAAVVIEDFIVRQFNSGRDFLAPVRLTAGLEYGLWKVGIQPFRQQPSEAKSAITDQRLKQWGFYSSRGGLNHARDADRHNLTFLRKCKDGQKGQTRRRLTWPHIYDKEN